MYRYTKFGMASKLIAVSNFTTSWSWFVLSIPCKVALFNGRSNELYNEKIEKENMCCFPFASITTFLIVGNILEKPTYSLKWLVTFEGGIGMLLNMMLHSKGY